MILNKADAFYKNLRKETFLLVCDTVLAYPAYQKIIDAYHRGAGDVCSKIKLPEQMEEYDAQLGKLNKKYENDLEKLLDERLGKFEITKETITDFFDAVVRLDSDILIARYTNPKGKEINKGVNSSTVRNLHMAYLAGMINKLNPKRIELTIPDGMVYFGPVGYNINFDGEVIIKGDGNLFCKNAKKGNFRVKGRAKELYVNSPDVNVTVDGNVSRLNIGPAGKIVVNGDILEAVIHDITNSVVINGSILESLYYHLKTIKNPPKIKGDVVFIVDNGGVIENAKDVYKLIKGIDIRGKITMCRGIYTCDDKEEQKVREKFL